MSTGRTPKHITPTELGELLGTVPARQRKLSAAERIEARHWLQQLSEQARDVRNAMDPQHGMHTVTADAWAAQWTSLKAELDSFTRRVIENKPSAGGVGDRNA